MWRVRFLSPASEQLQLCVPYVLDSDPGLYPNPLQFRWSLERPSLVLVAHKPGIESRPATY